MRAEDDDAEMVRQAEEMAAKEAAAIGGPGAEQGFPPEERAVREAGGGEAEGFEEAEAELVRNATHADESSSTVILERRGPMEEEGDRATAESAEADHLRTSQEG
jgi:hypothetical protein